MALCCKWENSLGEPASGKFCGLYWKLKGHSGPINKVSNNKFSKCNSNGYLFTGN
jgi:hypothetical protein